MSDTAHPKPPYLTAVQAQTHVTVSSVAAAPVFSGSTAMPDPCRTPNAGDAR